MSNATCADFLKKNCTKHLFVTYLVPLARLFFFFFFDTFLRLKTLGKCETKIQRKENRRKDNDKHIQFFLFIQTQPTFSANNVKIKFK